MYDKEFVRKRYSVCGVRNCGTSNKARRVQEKNVTTYEKWHVRKIMAYERYGGAVERSRTVCDRNTVV